MARMYVYVPSDFTSHLLRLHNSYGKQRREFEFFVNATNTPTFIQAYIKVSYTRISNYNDRELKKR